MSRLVPILFTLAVTALGDPRPSVVFILLDDVGWRDLACYGSDFHQTPHMDQLARDGMLFTQAYAASSTCSPTRASILTGQLPARLRITDYIPGENPGPLRAPHWKRQLEPGIQTNTRAFIFSSIMQSFEHFKDLLLILLLYTNTII